MEYAALFGSLALRFIAVGLASDAKVDMSELVAALSNAILVPL